MLSKRLLTCENHSSNVLTCTHLLTDSSIVAIRLSNLSVPIVCRFGFVGSFLSASEYLAGVLGNACMSGVGLVEATKAYFGFDSGGVGSKARLFNGRGCGSGSGWCM